MEKAYLDNLRKIYSAMTEDELILEFFYQDAAVIRIPEANGILRELLDRFNKTDDEFVIRHQILMNEPSREIEAEDPYHPKKLASFFCTQSFYQDWVGYCKISQEVGNSSSPTPMEYYENLMRPWTPEDIAESERLDDEIAAIIRSAKFKSKK